MKIITMNYLKESEGAKEYKIIPVHDGAEFLEGFSVKDLSKEDFERIAEIYREFEEKLAPFVKRNFRRFKKSNILNSKEEKV